MIRISEWKKSKKKGWEVDIRLRLPDGTWFQERRKAPVAGKANALRWAQDKGGPSSPKWHGARKARWKRPEEDSDAQAVRASF